ncbi:UNVERIFIED_ORG: hypothetical protein J2W74_001995 [Methylorubrum zatmanii]
MTTWIFQANPDQFDIDGYLSQHPAQISWLARQHAGSMRGDDQVFVWRSIGSGPKQLSGIVAEGYIEEEPVARDDDPESSPFWKDGGGAIEPRVRLRITRIELKNRFERHWLDHDPIMEQSSILKLRAGTNFRLTDEESVRLNALWRRAKTPWSYADTVAGLWAYWKTLGINLSRKPDAPITIAALQTGRVVKGMYNRVLNFRSLDETDDRAGLSSSSLMDRYVWDRFFDPVSKTLRGPEIEREYRRLWPEGLMPVPEKPSVERAAEPLCDESLDELLRRYHRKHAGKEERPRTYLATASVFDRDPEVVAIARVRADGRCELPGCSHELFIREDGLKFLEVHHIVPLSEGGRDHPDNVACLCPSHHREAHHGIAASDIRASLIQVRSSETTQ